MSKSSGPAFPTNKGAYIYADAMRDAPAFPTNNNHTEGTVMKEMIGHASNLILCPRLDSPPEVSAQIELVLICSEPSYSYGLDGITRNRVVSDLRVQVSHTQLRELGRKLIELAVETEKLELMINKTIRAAVSEEKE
jgi:hypothetical protein